MAAWRTRIGRLGALLGLLAGLSGCAAGYSSEMRGALRRLERRDYEAALASLEKPEGKTNKLLYRLERGLVLHYQGQFAASNVEFEKAEQLVDDLYTQSVSRQAAALLTNDAIIAYRGEEFERVLIHYYRALNYQYLGDLEGALVECRKANLKLEDYAQAADYELGYRNDAFLQYLTGLLYEAAGEWNDAWVSYRDAEKGYQAYAQLFGTRMPPELPRDLARVGRRLGYEEDTARLEAEYGLSPARPGDGLGGQAVVFVETGFIARKREQALDLPILAGDNTGEVWVVSDHMVYRYHHPGAYHQQSIRYWLRVAIPEYQTVPSLVVGARVVTAGQAVTATPVENLDAIALRTFEDKRDRILLRTAARAVAKYAAARGVQKAFDDDDGSEGDRLVKQGIGAALGILVNLFGAATEAADTRSWLSLPARIHMARVPLPSGPTDLTVEFLDGQGRVVEVQTLPGVQGQPGRPVFLNYRGYR